MNGVNKETRVGRGAGRGSEGSKKGRLGSAWVPWSAKRVIVHHDDSMYTRIQSMPAIL